MMNTKQNDAVNRVLSDIAQRAALARADMARVRKWQWFQMAHIAGNAAIVSLELFILSLLTRQMQPIEIVRVVVFFGAGAINLAWATIGFFRVTYIAWRDMRTVQRRWGFDPAHPLT